MIKDTIMIWNKEKIKENIQKYVNILDYFIKFDIINLSDKTY